MENASKVALALGLVFYGRARIPLRRCRHATSKPEPNILFEIDKAKTPKQIVLKTEQAGLHAALSLNAKLICRST
jgi:hypothetical protein